MGDSRREDVSARGFERSWGVLGGCLSLWLEKPGWEKGGEVVVRAMGLLEK